ncbi:MAG: YihY/virulence factor BrkB family protein [Thermodesulfobacteriota bacterium]
MSITPVLSSFVFRLGRILKLLPKAAVAWWNDDVFRLSASLAFYTIFSLAPIMLLATALAGMVFGEDTAQRQLVAQIEALVGTEGGRVVERMVETLRTSGSGAAAAAIGVLSVLIGSTVVFAELQSALNKIWDVRADASRGMLRDLVEKRVLSLILVIGVGFLLLVSLVIDAVLTGTQELLAAHTPSVPWLWQTVNRAVSFAITTLLFMMIYKLLPDVRLAWKDVAIGAFVTAILFSVGKVAIGFYLGRMSVGSAYGAAGSFVVLLVWIYYSALISFFGAEFTQVYARHEGSGLRPEPHAVRRGDKPRSA